MRWMPLICCLSSSQVDPNTGKEKKKLGGAYPGNRRPEKTPYVPPQSDFQKTGGNTSQATAHFISYGGGNALVLVSDANSPPQAASGGPPKEYISVTLPEGVSPGDTIHVQAPDGRLNAIIVPDGMYPGSTFTVEFASAPEPTKSSVPVATPAGASSSTNDDFVSGFNRPPGPRRPQNGYDDGFATGFNNPNATVQAEPDVNADASYPTAPAYSPSYTSKPY